jgi:hypothetical protein
VEGPFLSSLTVLAVFVGIPVLVILVISLLVYAPSWARGPRYRPGQPWESEGEWFGTSVAVDPSPALLQIDAEHAGSASTGRGSGSPDPDDVRRERPGSGGASAVW